MKYVFCFCLIFELITCSPMKGGSEEINVKKCVELNDSGIVYFKKYYLTKDTNDLNNALHFYNAASECDSNYSAPVHNKMAVYAEKKDKENSLKCINTLIRISNNEPSTILMLGMYIEGLGYVDSSNQVYRQVNASVKEAFLKDSVFNYNNVQVYLITNTILLGKETATEQCDSIGNIYKMDTIIVDQIESFKSLIDVVDQKGYLIPEGGNVISIPIQEKR